MTLSEDLLNSKKIVDTKEIIDHVIVLQMNKINKFTNAHPQETVTAATEEAMANLIELIALRNNYLKENRKY